MLEHVLDGPAHLASYPSLTHDVTADVAERKHSAGAQIFDRTTVKRIRPHGSGVELVTSDGPRIRAKRVVGYPGLAMILFLVAGTGGAWLAFNIVTHDRARKQRT